MADLSDVDHVVLLEALAVTAELTQTDLSEPAARVMAADLAAYPSRQVLAALTRCRRELKGRLTIAAVIERLDDGRPGAEEAWAAIPRSEDASVVWTEEMAQAYGVAAPLVNQGDAIAARMAFKETYIALVSKARSDRTTVRWTPSLGHDPAQRAAALQEAARKGRITQEHVSAMLPGPDRHEAERAVAMLSGPRPNMSEDVREQIAKLKLKLVSGGRE